MMLLVFDSSQVLEEVFTSALTTAAAAVQPLIAAQQALAAATGKSKRRLPLIWPAPELQAAVQALAVQKCREQYEQYSSTSGRGSREGEGGEAGGKVERGAAVADLQQQVLQDLRYQGLLAEGSPGGTGVTAVSPAAGRGLGGMGRLRV
jgi:polyribonucleotide nucleotidyltransferase